eukprot:TRINITY_DN9505_c0_g2_i2.p2 TRINITY_DN9505_c0_g2~~TRINITY_DN9505_c0_g2_i2.p2  ORF type:complete len:140 (+),score=4.76 TRINITY_DN9505_c0_g2_i2:528-947(+)
MSEKFILCTQYTHAIQNTIKIYIHNYKYQEYLHHISRAQKCFYEKPIVINNHTSFRTFKTQFNYIQLNLIFIFLGGRGSAKHLPPHTSPQNTNNQFSQLPKTKQTNIDNNHKLSTIVTTKSVAKNVRKFSQNVSFVDTF